MASSTRKGLYLSKRLQNCLNASARVSRQYPIPRQQTPYAYAKIAEYIEKDLQKAETLYRQAIAEGERPESALKDLAGVLHQQGKTKEACELLQSNRHMFVSDVSRFENLLKNLQKQIMPSPNTFNKSVKVSGLGLYVDELTVRGLFENPSRITEIRIDKEQTPYGENKFAIVSFGSHSAARKTFEGFRGIERYGLHWMNVQGEITGEVNIWEKTEFSLFSSGNEHQKPTYSGYYTYFSDSMKNESSDLVDELLENSIFSYLRPSRFEMRVGALPFEP